MQGAIAGLVLVVKEIHGDDVADEFVKYVRSFNVNVNVEEVEGDTEDDLAAAEQNAEDYRQAFDQAKEHLVDFIEAALAGSD